MLITAEFLFWHKGYREFQYKFGSQGLAECIIRIWTGNLPILRTLLCRPYEATFSWSFVHSHFLCKSLNVVCADYLIIFWNLLRLLFATFFKCRLQKQASKDHLTQGNILKTTLNEKQSNLEKEMYWNISLYSQHFLPGARSNVHKTLLLLKTNKKVFYFTFLDKKAQYEIKNIYI